MGKNIGPGGQAWGKILGQRVLYIGVGGGGAKSFSCQTQLMLRLN